MSMKSIIMTTTGAAAGMLIGNYLYETDKKANAEKENPVPFYTVRKAAEDISKKAEETYNDIKAKFNKKNKSEESTEEVVVETTEEIVEAEVVESVPEDNKDIDESKVIDVEVVDEKAVPVNQENVNQDAEVKTTNENESNVEPIIPASEETTIPKFTITDAPAAPVETQTPVNQNNETIVPMKKPSNNKKTTKKAEQ